MRDGDDLREDVPQEGQEPSTEPMKWWQSPVLIPALAVAVYMIVFMTHLIGDR